MITSPSTTFQCQQFAMISSASPFFLSTFLTPTTSYRDHLYRDIQVLPICHLHFWQWYLQWHYYSANLVIQFISSFLCFWWILLFYGLRLHEVVSLTSYTVYGIKHFFVSRTTFIFPKMYVNYMHCFYYLQLIGLKQCNRVIYELFKDLPYIYSKLFCPYFSKYFMYLYQCLERNTKKKEQTL